MPYRILKYELNIMESVLIDIKYINKKYEYPLVIPIVLYTGKEKWNANLDLKRTQYKWEKYKIQELSKYNILDINKISNKELLEETSIISKIMLIEKSKSKEELSKNLNKIYIEIKKNKTMYTKREKQFLEKAVGILALNLIEEKKLKKFLKNINLGDDGTMLAVIDMINEEKKLRKMELEKKWNDGKAEGRLQAKIDDIKNMLKEKLPIELISKITGLTKEEIEKYSNN